MSIARIGTLLVLAACSALAVGADAANAAETTIDFESLSGPSLFCPSPRSPTIGLATFSGGTVMREVVNMPANASTVYGTAPCPGYDDEITIAFARPVSNVGFKFLNGDVVTVSYTVVADTGSTETRTLDAWFLSGWTTFSLPGDGITSVTIRATTPATFWDFFIDDVRFTTPDACLVSGWARIDVGGGRSVSVGVYADSRLGEPTGRLEYADPFSYLFAVSTQIDEVTCTADGGTVRGRALTRLGLRAFELSVTSGGTPTAAGDRAALRLGSYVRQGPAIAGNLSVSQP